MVNVHNITITTKTNTLLQNVSCTLLSGSVTSFIGPSGAGKTTLLNAIAGLTKITQGTIVNNNERIGYVFQDFNLFPHFTVLENCVDPLIVCGMTRVEAEVRARSVLENLGMQDVVEKYPSELSGGQRQRVAIARALSLNPAVLLLDEPTASLDPFNSEILVKILKTLAVQGFNIALSSQDMNFVRKVFDRVYYIKNGKIIEFCDNKNNIPRTIAEFIESSMIT